MTFMYSGNVTSEIASVCDFVSQLVEELESRVDFELAMDLRLILSELMINGCEHGNENDRRKLVYIDFILEDDFIELIVRDEGGGFCLEENTKWKEDLRSSGRGLKLVSGLCDEFFVRDSEVVCRIHRKKER